MRRILKVAILITIILLGTVNLFGQINIKDFYNLEKIAPPSPNASSLGKYVEIPVSLYTGIPNIGIPIYDIYVDEFSLPVNLSYHAGGVKVEEIASWVGLGWTLNAGGAITRTVRGLPDELYDTGFIDHNPNDPQRIITSLLDSEVNGNDERDYLYLIANGIRDGQADIYYFNFGNYSGKFIFDRDGYVRLLEGENLKIDYQTTTTYLTYPLPSTFINGDGDEIQINWNDDGIFSKPIEIFTITTDDGVIYEFSQKEETKPEYYYIEGSEYEYINGTMNGVSIDPWSFTEINYNTLDYISAWYLTKVSFPNKPEEKSIYFSYEPETLYYSVGVNETFYNKFEAVVPLKTPKIQRTNTAQRTYGTRLSEITWSNGKLEFIESTEPRRDMNDEGNMQGKYLDKIMLYSKRNNTLQYDLIKTFELEHSYFTPHPSTYYSFYPSFFERLRLDAIYEVYGSEKKPPYLFTYNSTKLPSRNSAEVDYWGFYKHNSAKTRKPNIYCKPDDPDNSLFNSIYSIYPRGGDYYFDDGYDREADVNDAQAGILKEIIFPTGGKQVMDYELNTFMVGTENKSGGGLRVKSITLSDFNQNSPDIVKQYFYTDDSYNSSGRIAKLPEFSKFNRFATTNFLTSVEEEFYKKTLTRFSNSQGGLGSTKGSIVGYTQVTVIETGNGKTVYNYDFPGAFDVAQDILVSPSTYLYNKTEKKIYVYDELEVYDYPGYTGYVIVDNDNFPFLPNPDIDFARGKLISEKIYDETGSLKMVTDYEYYVNYLGVIGELCANIYNTEGAIYAAYTTDNYGNVIAAVSPTQLYLHEYRWGTNHFIVSAWKLLSKKTTVLDNITTVNDYDYTLNGTNGMDFLGNMQKSTFFFPFKDSYTSSSGDIKTTKYKRLANYTFADLNHPMMKLKKDFILRPIIEQIEWSNSLITGAQLVEYGNFSFSTGSYYLPHKLYSFNSSTPLTETEFGENLADHLPFTYLNNTQPYYTLEATMNYTKAGLVSNVQKPDDINRSIIWGYNSSYPIARIINGETTESSLGGSVSYIGFESNNPVDNDPDNDYWPLSGGNIVNDAYTGHYSLASIVGNNFALARDFQPNIEFKNEKFVLSAWIKAGSNCDGRLVLVAKNDDGSALTGNSNTWYKSSQIFGNTQGQWEYFEVEIDLKEVRENNQDVDPNELLIIQCQIWSPSGNCQYYIDDVRFHSSEAQVTTYTYKPLIGITSMSNENNISSFYNYDAANRLVEIKDDEKNILKKYEYNYSNSIDQYSPCDYNTPLYESFTFPFVSGGLPGDRWFDFYWTGGEFDYTVEFELFDNSGNQIGGSSFVETINTQYTYDLSSLWPSSNTEDHLIKITITDSNGCQLFYEQTLTDN